MCLQDVLGLVCAKGGDLKTTCSVICTSKRGRESVLQHCHRTLTVRVDSIRLQIRSPSEHQGHVSSVTKWLVAYGALVRQLVFTPLFRSCTPQIMAEIEACLTSALQSRLQQLEVLELEGTKPRLLQHVRPQHLTSLIFRTSYQQGVERLSCLSSFTALQSLSVSDLSIGSTLPPLTSLTTMTIIYNDTLWHRKQQQHQLPSTLQSLFLSSLPAGRTPSFVNLSSLQTLTLQDPQCSRQELLSLNALPQLQHLSISYYTCDGDIAEDHALVFGSLHALDRLDIGWGDGDDLSAPLAAGVSASTSLTYLGISCCDLEPGLDLGTVLQPLQKLQSLSVKTLGSGIAKPEGDPLTSLGRISRHLTSLTSLTLCWPLQLRALVEIYNMSQLQQLYLVGTDIGDEGFDVIAHNLQNLRVLGVGNSKISVEKVLELLIKPEVLPQLQRLIVASDEWMAHGEEEVWLNCKLFGRQQVDVMVKDGGSSWWMEQDD